MRILAITDIHGSHEKVDEILSREEGYDVVIIGGDLTTNGTPKEAEEAIKRFKAHGKPLMAVAGNMDPPVLDGLFEKLGVSINARGTIMNDVGFFGVSASPPTPFHTPYEISEEEIKRRSEQGLKEVQSARWKVFVPHPPPHGTKLDKVLLGKHVGSTAVRTFIDEHQPDVVVCGHIHEARGLDALGKSNMVNCGPAGRGYYAVIEIGKTVTVETRG